MDMHSEGPGSVDVSRLAIEYNALRDEIVKRIGLRQQTLSITLTIAGVFLGIGVTTHAVALVYPALATFLAIGWAQNDLRIKHAATYIRDHLEAKTPHLGWETHVHERREETKGRAFRLVILSHSGIFVLTQMVAIVIGLLTFEYTPLEWALLGIDVLAILAVVWIARMARR
jgi:hypothetical protein